MAKLDWNPNDVLMELYSGKFLYPHQEKHGVRLKDRTGEISYFTGNDPEKFTLHNYDPTPLPEVKTTSNNVQQVSALRVQEIKAVAEEVDKPICVFWSGGIDSTVALCAFLEASNTVFHVAMSKETGDEYPKLYTQIRDGVKDNDGVESVVDVKAFPSEWFAEKFVCVTGELGDQLCTSTNHFKNMDDKILRTDLLKTWEETIPEHYITDEIRASLSHSPNEIVTLGDWFWWFNFTLKYHAVENRVYANPRDTFESGLAQKQSKSWQHFFAGDEWQRWAMSNREACNEYIRENDTTLNKMPFKEYIYDYTGDLSYKLYKQKEFSLGGEMILLRYEDIDNY